MSDQENEQFPSVKTAFRRLFDEWYLPLCSFALKITRDPAEAEEIVQDVFVKIWQKRTELSLNNDLKGYLFQAVKNSSLNHIKHLKVVRKHEKDMAGNTPVSTGQNDHLVEEELQERIKHALNKLPTERRKVFLLSRSDGMKYQQIADHLNISIKTVENQMGKALKTLREELAQYLPSIINLLICLIYFFYGMGVYTGMIV